MESIWLLEARSDFERLLGFLVEVNPPAAERAARLIRGGIDRIQQFPDIGRPMPDDTDRRKLFLPFGASAHGLRHCIENAVIVMIRVWRGREARNGRHNLHVGGGRWLPVRSENLRLAPNHHFLPPAMNPAGKQLTALPPGAWQ